MTFPFDEPSPGGVEPQKAKHAKALGELTRDEYVSGMSAIAELLGRASEKMRN